MPHTSTVFVACFNAVLQAASAYGVNKETLLQGANIQASLLSVPSERLPVEKFIHLYQLAEERTGDPDLGLNVGRIIYFMGLNLHLYMTTICRNLKEYLNVIPSTHKMRGDLGQIIIRPEGDYIRLEWHPLDSSTSAMRYLSDEMLSSSALIVGSICNRQVAVQRAEFSYARPASVDVLENTLCKDLRFDCPVSALYFSRSSLRYSLIKLDYGLGVEFKAVTQSLFGTQAGVDPFLRDMKAVISRSLPTGELSIDSVSNDLGISRRTLQRRLTERESSFKLLVQTIREDMAARYLLDPRLCITDIAFLLGYSDQASFSNAFKGWRECSPSEYRNQHQG